MPLSLTVEPTGETETGIRECCGHTSRRSWGLVYRNEYPHAAYFVHWTHGHVAQEGATWDIVLGRWGDETSATDRFAARLLSRHGETNDFMVVDGYPTAMVSLAAVSLRRNEIVGRPLAQEIFA